MTKLGDVCEIVMGQAPPGHSYNYSGEGVPLIAGAGDFKNGDIVPTKFTTSPGRLSEPGDVVLSIRASIGAKVWSGGSYCLGRGVAAIRPQEGLDRSYLWHWLGANEAALAAKGRGATFLQVTRRDIADMPMQLPSMVEQRRIAAILDHADALRAKRRQALAHLDDLSQSIFHHMFGHGPWVRVPLGEVAKTSSGGTPNRATTGNFGGPIPWVKSGELHAGVVTESEESLTEAGLSSSAAKLLPEGTVLLAMYGATAGVVGLLGVPAATNQAVCAITPGPDLRTEYLVAALRARADVLLQRRSGGAQPNLSQASVRSLLVEMPPLSLQETFGAIVGRLAAVCDQQLAAGGLDDELFASLQSRAFRGEL